VPQAAIRIVPPGVDTELFQPEGPAASRGGRPRLLMVVASLAGDREPAAALHALAAVPGAELFIAGGPPTGQLAGDPGHQALSKLAGQLGVTDRVTFTGQLTQADAPALMRSADVLLNLSPGAPLARVTIEAMACGVPVIAISSGAHQDAVLDGTTGYLTASTQPAPLARRIRQLLATPLREGMAIAAASRARDRYSWARIGTETLAVYQTAAVQETAPAAGEPEPASAVGGPVDEP
jgi:glycosyltransferase involved in cell wall biosynthesis